MILSGILGILSSLSPTGLNLPNEARGRADKAAPFTIKPLRKFLREFDFLVFSISTVLIFLFKNRNYEKKIPHASLGSGYINPISLPGSEYLL
jgi:hypothetical protein